MRCAKCGEPGEINYKGDFVHTCKKTMEAKDVNKIFDDLCTEIYYGFNMRLVLMNMPEDEVKVIQKFINACEKGRERKGE